ncbi:MAG: hypothetical protein ABIJ45_01415 [Candidatus Zixiibacteriota bacterium]
MPPRKEAEQFADVGVKDCWHPYGLQGLSPEKFGEVVSLILSGKYDLLKLKWDIGSLKLN